MSLEQAYYIGQLVAAIVLVASLIYLAIEVRQNTKIAKLNSSHMNTQIYTQFMELVCSNGELADIYLRGLDDPAALTPVEQIRFNTLLAITFRNTFQHFQEHNSGLLPDDDWDAWNRASRAIMSFPGYRTVWKRRKSMFNEKFQAYLDEAAQNADSESNIYTTSS